MENEGLIGIPKTEKIVTGNDPVVTGMLGGSSTPKT